ncbi:MAG TPA: Trm112 family protein [Candidatus Binatia bacterium]|jgi:uncharacterized protein YbaR (Trm112 family)|nr:Trm112 family protein [Candidatus Binatia bacterium]
MLDPDLLKILCCPETHQALRLAEPAALEQLNRQIETGALKNRGGQPIKEKLENGLVRGDGKFLYPIRRGIPVMLIEEGVPLGS